MTDYKTDLLTDLADPAYAALYVSRARKESPEEFLVAIRDVAECRATSADAIPGARASRELLSPTPGTYD